MTDAGYSWRDAIADIVADGAFYVLRGGSPTGDPPPGTVFLASPQQLERWEWIVAKDILAAIDAADPLGYLGFAPIAAAARAAMQQGQIMVLAAGGPVRVSIARCAACNSKGAT